MTDISLTSTYTCKGKGGRYVVSCVALGAGTSREYGQIVVYFDVITGRAFYRTLQDFLERMEVTH